jgi:hypothetical protein
MPDQTMPNYFVLKCMGKPETMFFAMETEVENGECWAMGRRFASENRNSDFHPPTGVIDLDTRIDSKVKERIYPEYASNPLPLMSRRLVAALQEAGVDNIQAYETRLINPQGSPPIAPDYYQAVNIVGSVAAADLGASQTNPDVTEKLISMDFHSLTIDELKARDLLMFRLAENVSAVLVHEHVRKIVEAKGIDTLTWYEPEGWAG